jgi:hypothetical protein
MAGFVQPPPHSEKYPNPFTAREMLLIRRVSERADSIKNALDKTSLNYFGSNFKPP